MSLAVEAALERSRPARASILLDGGAPTAALWTGLERSVAALSTALVLLCGCDILGRGVPRCSSTDEYVLAEGRARAPAANDGPPEVTPTPALTAMRDQLKTVAVRVPEACATCDAWARALERSLAAAGYRVLSGESVRQVEKTEGIPVHAAAEKAGADVVFAFSDITAKVDTIPRTFEFSASDANGAKLSPMSLAEADRASLEGIITSRVEPSRASVTALRVEGTVVVASTGEIVLTYRRSATLVGPETPVFALFVNNHKTWSVVKPEHPAPPPPSPPPPQKMKDPSGVLSDWATDFVARFHG